MTTSQMFTMQRLGDDYLILEIEDRPNGELFVALDSGAKLIINKNGSMKAAKV